MSNNLPLVDIAECVGISHKRFAELPAYLKWNYFFKVHAGILKQI